jgi:hypothetical protein
MPCTLVMLECTLVLGESATTNETTFQAEPIFTLFIFSFFLMFRFVLTLGRIELFIQKVSQLLLLYLA